MVTFTKYADMQVTCLQATHAPDAVTGAAYGLCFRKSEHTDDDIVPSSEKLYEYVKAAGHTSPLEHINFLFLAEGVTRALLTQLTRHRHGSFTVSSQHYNDVSDWNYSDIQPAKTHKPGEASTIFRDAVRACHEAYVRLSSIGVEPAEARMVLPAASHSILYWTVNARSMLNFLEQRLCHRNTVEMQIFAAKVKAAVVAEVPKLFTNWGPQCTHGLCLQGKMQCEYKTYIPRSIDYEQQ